jgi:hypothetical protein
LRGAKSCQLVNEVAPHPPSGICTFRLVRRSQILTNLRQLIKMFFCHGFPFQIHSIYWFFAALLPLPSHSPLGCGRASLPRNPGPGPPRASASAPRSDNPGPPRSDVVELKAPRWLSPAREKEEEERITTEAQTPRQQSSQRRRQARQCR